MDKKRKTMRIVGVINFCVGIFQFVMFSINLNKANEYESKVRTAIVLGNQCDVGYYRSMADTYTRNKNTCQILAITLTSTGVGLFVGSHVKGKNEK